MQGTIHRLIRGKGFGFIQNEERQYFFHHTEVRGIEFRQLSVGDVVEFQPVEEEAGKNPRAVEVLVLVKAVAPPPRPAAPEVAAEPKPRARPERAASGRGPARSSPRPVRRPPRSDGFGSGLFSDDAFAPPVSRAEGAGGDGEEMEFIEELPADGVDGNTRNPPERSGQRSAGSPGAGRPRADGGRLGGGGPGSGPRRSGFARGGAGGRRPEGDRSRSRPEDRPRRPRAEGSSGARGEGVIRSINAERGFGFIETSAGDIFFHRSGVKVGFESLAVGSRVAFVFGAGDRGAKAEDISAV